MGTSLHQTAAKRLFTSGPELRSRFTVQGLDAMRGSRRAIPILALKSVEVPGCGRGTAESGCAAGVHL